MDVYKALNGVDADAIAMSIRGMGCKAWVERDGDDVLLVTRYRISSVNFRWVDRL